jgi:hypothetical protein
MVLSCGGGGTRAPGAARKARGKQLTGLGFKKKRHDMARGWESDVSNNRSSQFNLRQTLWQPE